MDVGRRENIDHTDRRDEPDRDQHQDVAQLPSSVQRYPPWKGHASCLHPGERNARIAPVTPSPRHPVTPPPAARPLAAGPQ